MPTRRDEREAASAREDPSAAPATWPAAGSDPEAALAPPYNSTALRPAAAPLPRPGRALELSLFALLLLAAMAVRVRRLGVPVLTGDEWFMYRNYLEGPAWIVHQARTFEPHPLLYYLGFWSWLGVAGTTEWAMRYPSVLFGLLTCAAIWRLARDAGGGWAGLGSLLLAAVNPYQIAQSQNARNYAMVAALATLATALLLVASRRGGRHWYGYGIALFIALNTHLNAVLAAAAHVAWLVAGWVVRRERPERRALRTFGAVGVLFLAWIVYALPALTSYPGYFPEKVGFVEVLRRSLASFAFGQLGTDAQAFLPWPPVQLAAEGAPRRVLVVALAGLATVAAAGAARVARQRTDDAAALVALAALLPVSGAAAAFLVRPMFEERYLIVAAPALIALIALGAAQLGRVRWPLGAGIVLALAYVSAPFIPVYYQHAEADRPDWRGLAAWIAESARPGEVVVITGDGVADLYGYYGRARIPTFLAADASIAAGVVSSLVAMGAVGAYHLPFLDTRSDRTAQEQLAAIGFAGESRWFRSQRAEYFALPGRTPFPPGQPIDARWRGVIVLKTAAVGPPRAAPGEPVAVALAWTSTGAAPDLKESVRLVAPDGRPVAQLDRRPVDEMRPFPTIAAGETIRDGHALRVPRDAIPGRYEATVLLYDPNDAKAVRPSADAARLRSENHDLVRLGVVEVAPR